MKPMPGLAALLDKAKTKLIFGTKMRSFIKQANRTGIKNIAAQQFEAARQIIAAGLVPIVEAEVDIHCPEKAEAEELLKSAILEELDRLPARQVVMLKITLPEKDDLYAEFVGHPKVVSVLALSGGYTRKEGNTRLRRNHGVVASSFSKGLPRQARIRFSSIWKATTTCTARCSGSGRWANSRGSPSIRRRRWRPSRRSSETLTRYWS